MSITSCQFTYPESYLRRESLRRFFADFVEGARHRANRKVGEAARLAGMKVPDWLAIETGCRRPDLIQIDFMAPVLQMSREQMERIVSMCAEAWE